MNKKNKKRKQSKRNEKVVAVIPTYNEKENIEELIRRLRGLRHHNLSILVVDDDSPDGTAQIVKKVMKKYKNVHLLLRKKRKGRGYAGRAGFIQALKKGADIIIEMDADLSHDPKYIPKMLSAIESSDVVLGSRLVKGGKDIGRSLLRQIITKGANLYIRLLLDLRVKDCNSGFRAFRKEVFNRVKTQNLFSEGPAIVQELLYKCHLAKCRIREVPIEFVDRTRGESSLTLRKLIKGYTTVLLLKYKKLTKTLRL